ncbi:MAG: hypothetical protein H0V92_00505 [Pseudonocardiales bacterium]|nr:hypothetical protein [Pseudonocardiales bacterium]
MPNADSLDTPSPPSRDMSRHLHYGGMPLLTRLGCRRPSRAAAALATASGW